MIYIYIFFFSVYIDDVSWGYTWIFQLCLWGWEAPKPKLVVGKNAALKAAKAAAKGMVEVLVGFWTKKLFHYYLSKNNI